MILAAHQPNLIPPYSYFLKMEVCDVFVILRYVQFSKTGFQNYQNIFSEKWTIPVRSGNIPINEKRYVNGHMLFDVNMHWIMAIAKTLGIDTSKITYDEPTEATGTERLAELCTTYDCNIYLSNPKAIEKYLDLDLLHDNGIAMMPFETEEKRHIFEMFADMGIEKTAEHLKREAVKIKENYRNAINKKPN